MCRNVKLRDEVVKVDELRLERNKEFDREQIKVRESTTQLYEKIDSKL